MINLPQEMDNLSKYYTQKKQRIDLYLDMNKQKVVGLTKLTFEAKNDNFDEIPENLNLYLNAENININYIKLQKNSKKELQENKFFSIRFFLISLSSPPRNKTP